MSQSDVCEQCGNPATHLLKIARMNSQTFYKHVNVCGPHCGSRVLDDNVVWEKIEGNQTEDPFDGDN